MKKSKTFYVCGVAWQFDPDFNVFKTIRDLKINRTCWKECGILEIKARPIKWRSKQKV